MSRVCTNEGDQNLLQGLQSPSVAVAHEPRQAEFFKNCATNLKFFVEVAFLKSSLALSQLEVS
jgi:hypothetical protein